MTVYSVFRTAAERKFSVRDYRRSFLRMVSPRKASLFSYRRPGTSPIPRPEALANALGRVLLWRREARLLNQIIDGIDRAGFVIFVIRDSQKMSAQGIRVIEVKRSLFFANGSESILPVRHLLSTASRAGRWILFASTRRWCFPGKRTAKAFDHDPLEAPTPIKELNAI